MTTNPPRLLTTAQAAAYLGIKQKTFENWRTQKRGPAHVRLGHRTVRYRRETLDAWLAARESITAA